MSKEQCDNYSTCQKYALYGKCEHEDDNQFPSLNSFCNAYEKQTIKILASIDEKLSLLLAAKAEK